MECTLSQVDQKWHCSVPPHGDMVEIYRAQAKTFLSSDVGVESATVHRDANGTPIVQVDPKFQAAYYRIRGQREKYVRFMGALGHELNRTKFGGLLSTNKFGLTKKVDASRMRTRAHWSPLDKMVRMSENLFNADWNKFCEIFLHEMCHQAVHQIDNVYETAEAGHGPHWKAWMERVGLDPRRYDPEKNTTYMTEKERKATEERVKGHQEIRERVNQGELTRITPEPHLFCTVNWNGKLHHGILVKQVPKGWAFISIMNMLDDRYSIVRPDQVYRCTSPESIKKFTAAEWSDAVSRVRRAR
jgi:hypothetical protein